MATALVYFSSLWTRANTGVVTHSSYEGKTVACEIATGTIYDSSPHTGSVLVLPGISLEGSKEGIPYTDASTYGGNAYWYQSAQKRWYPYGNLASSNYLVSAGSTTKGEEIAVKAYYKGDDSWAWYAKFRVISLVDVTIDNSQSPISLAVSGATTTTVAAGETAKLSLEAGAKLTLALSTDLTYQKKFVAYKVGSTTKGTATTLSYTVSGGETIVVTWQTNPTATLTAPANANLTATLTWGSPTQTETITASAGTSATIYIPPKNARLVLSCTAINGAEFYKWLKNGSTTAITANNPSLAFSPASGDVYSCTTRTPYTVTLTAPAGITLAYTFGLDGTQQAAGSVSPGTSKGVKLYRESGGNMTLVLEATPFNLDTFGGWTKNGTVVDPYSNPATFIANEAATYSCKIGQASTPTTSSGKLLYGKYGNLLYANTLKAASTHTIALSADFEVSGHIITCSITKPGEAQETATTEIPTAFSREKNVSFPATGSASGKLLFADQSAPLPSGSLASQKRLVKILFHCDNSVHKYTLTLKVDGSERFKATLSGTFSRTIEVS